MASLAYLFVILLLHVVAAVVCTAIVDASNETAVATVVYDIPKCTHDQLKLGEAILTTEPNTLRCEAKFDIKPGMLLQSASIAVELCGEQSCLNALRTLLFTLPSCRYELWGLKYSAAKLLNHCGIVTNVSGVAA